jgi:hypothetical protein
MITEVFMSGVVLNNLSKFIVCIHIHTGCLMKNASTHNFFIYYPISMNKKIKDMVFQALQNSHKIYFFGVIFNS